MPHCVNFEDIFTKVRTKYSLKIAGASFLFSGFFISKTISSLNFGNILSVIRTNCQKINRPVALKDMELLNTKYGYLCLGVCMLCN